MILYNNNLISLTMSCHVSTYLTFVTVHVAFHTLPCSLYTIVLLLFIVYNLWSSSLMVALCG